LASATTTNRTAFIQLEGKSKSIGSIFYMITSVEFSMCQVMPTVTDAITVV